MAENLGPQKISSLLFQPKKPAIKAPAYEWQELALRIIRDFAVPGFKRNSVFKVCKDNSKDFIEKAVNETKELCKSGEKWKYFFKVVESLKKPKTPQQ